MRRVGIYAGAFNPVHAGHITFALQALEAAKLDIVYFMPERRPRDKQVEHFGHRVAMLKRATKPHPKFRVMELEDLSFTVEKTLPRLRRRLPDSQLVFLFGSDTTAGLMNWPKAETLLRQSELVIGVREHDDPAQVKAAVEAWTVQPMALHIFRSFAADVSSRQVRAGISRREYVHGLLSSVQRYSDQHWLYVSLAQS